MVRAERPPKICRSLSPITFTFFRASDAQLGSYGPGVPARCPEDLLKQLTAPGAESLVPRTRQDRIIDSKGVLSQVLGEGMSSKKHFSLPVRQEYFFDIQKKRCRYESWGERPALPTLPSRPAGQAPAARPPLRRGWRAEDPHRHRPVRRLSAEWQGMRWSWDKIAREMAAGLGTCIGPRASMQSQTPRFGRCRP